jgi:hypothetical protein
LDGDDLQFDASVIDPDEDEPVVEIIRGWRDNNWISGIFQSDKCVGLADPVPSCRLSEPNLLHVLLCATQWPGVNSVAQNFGLAVLWGSARHLPPCRRSVAPARSGPHAGRGRFDGWFWDSGPLDLGLAASQPVASKARYEAEAHAGHALLLGCPAAGIHSR